MENQPKNQFYQPLLFAGVLIIGMFLGFKIASSYFSNKSNLFSSKDDEPHLDYLISLIDEKYVDSLDKQKLYENGIEGIISALDPHTVYIPPQETDRVNEELEGNIYGVGIEFFIYKDTIHIISILDNSPAKSAAINPGDKILKIDDSLVAGKKMEDGEVIKLIKGKENTRVALTIQKPDGKVNTIKLKRETITYNSITSSYVLPHQKDIGYIAIRMFSENTYEEFKDALEKLLEKNINKLIIDVRDNPGGYMQAVTSILDELISGKHVLLTTKSKSETETVQSDIDGMFEKGQIAVLINESSASASEILAGAIQDLDRGTLIGRRSYGKGLVQEQFSLANNGALRLTVSRYYLPSGRCIQKDYSKGKSEYHNEVYERFITKKITREDSVKSLARPKFYTTAKRIVYGNEGVMPDVVVTLDTAYTESFDSVYSYNLVEMYAATYYYTHTKDFQVYKDAEQFESEFHVSNIVSDALLHYMHEQVASFSSNDFTKFKNKIYIVLKAEFAKLHLGNNAKYMVLSNDDKMIKAAAASFKKAG